MTFSDRSNDLKNQKFSTPQGMGGMGVVGPLCPGGPGGPETPTGRGQNLDFQLSNHISGVFGVLGGRNCDHESHSFDVEEVVVVVVSKWLFSPGEVVAELVGSNSPARPLAVYRRVIRGRSS